LLKVFVNIVAPSSLNRGNSIHFQKKVLITNGLYNKHFTILNDDCRWQVMTQAGALLKRCQLQHS
jgi:hypothetical protein